MRHSWLLSVLAGAVLAQAQDADMDEVIVYITVTPVVTTLNVVALSSTSSTSSSSSTSTSTSTSSTSTTTTTTTVFSGASASPSSTIPNNVPSSITTYSPSPLGSAVGRTSASGGPIAVAESYCFPGSWSGPNTDTPCYSQEVLNQACFYGPSVFSTATATPTVTASPQEQQQCYCDPVNGAGYMFFEYMSGCSNCFRKHGSLGGPGAYKPSFINALSQSYCGMTSQTLAFGKFLTSFAGSTIPVSSEISTRNILGTRTEVSLYFTTSLLGGDRSAIVTGTAASRSTGVIGSGSLVTAGTGTGSGSAGIPSSTESGWFSNSTTITSTISSTSSSPSATAAASTTVSAGNASLSPVGFNAGGLATPSASTSSSSAFGAASSTTAPASTSSSTASRSTGGEAVVRASAALGLVMLGVALWL